MKELKLTLKSFDNSCPWQVEATLNWGGPLWLLDYQIKGEEKGYWWPPLTENKREIGLWENTCLEAFFLFSDGSYEEWNFGPHGAWNCFSFSSYRTPQKLVEKSVEPPNCKNKGTGHLALAIDGKDKNKDKDAVVKVNLTAVIKTNDQKFYLAHKHPKAAPDFHLHETFYPLESSSF